MSDGGADQAVESWPIPFEDRAEVPAWLLSCVSPRAVAAYAVLFVMRRFPYVPMWVMAERLHCSMRAASRAVLELEDAGAVTVLRVHGRENSYILQPEGLAR